MGKEPNAILLILAALAITIGAIIIFPHVVKFEELGYFGVFVISLVSSATIFIPLPGFAFVFAAGAYLNPVLVGIAAGIGSAIGETTGYLAGLAGHEKVEHVKLYREHKKGIMKHGPVAIFVLAFLPNPVFDLAGIASGAIRMQYWKFFVATAAGKVLRYIALAYAGGAAIGYLF